ncbi:MAG: hypothetical protein IT384_27005 [Deltaproteobacteria bacterium]|nr:hypothetical protein [Deltaproteobacteria bacterium]
MGGRWIVVVGSVALATACSPTSLIMPVEAPAGSMGIAVVFAEREGRPQVREARLIDDVGLASPLALRAGEEVAVLWWPKQQVVDPQGAPLAETVLDQARVVIESGPAPAPGLGECGRCLVPAEQAPSTIFPGDLCPPPSFATALVGDRAATPAESKALRAQLAIAWPGACSCPSVVPRPVLKRLESEAVLPGRGSRASRFLAIDAQGAVLAAAEDRLQVFSPAGDPLPPLADPELFDRRQVVMAVPPGRNFGGGFLVVDNRQDPDAVYYEIITIGERAAERHDAGGPGTFRPDDGAVLGEGSVLLAGTHERVLRVDRCTLSGAPALIECQSEDPCPGRICPVEDGISLAPAENGWVVVGVGGGILFRETGGRWWTGQVTGVPGSSPFFTAATIVGGRLWGCSVPELGSAAGALVTAPLSGVLPSSIPVEVVLEYGFSEADTATTCHRLWAEPSRQAVWMESRDQRSSGHRLVRLNVDGTLTSSVPLSDRPLLGVSRSDADGWATSGADGSIFRSSPGATHPVQLAGPARPAIAAPAVMATTDGALVLDTDHQLHRLRWAVESPASLSELVVTPLGITLPAESGVRSQLLTPDLEPGGALRVVHRASTLTIDRIDLASGQSARLMSQPVPIAQSLQMIAPWADLRLFLFSGPAGTSLWSWRIGAPGLTPIDGAPSVSGIAGGPETAFVWVGDRVLRARRAGERVLLEEVPFASVSRGADDPAPGPRWIIGLRSVCPDALDVITNFENDVALLRLCLSGDCAGSAGASTEPLLRTLIQANVVTSPVTIVGPPEDPAVIGARGMSSITHGRLEPLPFGPPYAVVNGRSRSFFLAGPYGWLAAGLLHE